jgi:pimeloyl-ACP methyl ester carboxylesterase
MSPTPLAGASANASGRASAQQPAWDGVTVARGEGFRLEDIQPEVLIWHGEQDRNDPVAMARAQEQRLPHVKARYYGSDGHLIFFSRIQEILPALARR